MTALPIHTGQFAVDLHGFFTLSFAHREDYSSMEELIDIMSKYLLRHSSVRWLTTAQEMKFSIKDFFGKCDQICSFLRIWSHLLKKSLMENFIFSAVNIEICFSQNQRQCENLRKYFLSFLPKSKEFKRYVKDSKRYKNIV